MADLITDLIADITTKMETITAIKDKIIYMFDQNDLTSEVSKIGLPAIGVVYNGMTGGQDGPASGLAATVTIDIYILGGQQCVEKISRETGVKTTTTQFLEDIRNAIKLTVPLVGTGAAQAPRPGAQRKWMFVFESPVQFEDESISYVQRWNTKVLLTS